MTTQTKQLVEDLINKCQIQLDTVREVINTTDDERTKIASEACERFIKGFIIDLKAITAYEQSTEQPEESQFKLAEIVLREYVKFGDVNGHKTVNLLPLTIVDAMVEFADRLNEQPEAIAGENYITSLVDESFKGLAELIHDNDLFEFYKQLIVTLYEEYTASKDKQLQVQQSHIDDQDQLIFEQDKEITELKEAIAKLIQVKTRRLENAKKLIQK